MAQWLECGALPMSLPAARFRTPLGAGCFSPLNLGTLFRYCVIRQGTSPQNASLHPGHSGRTDIEMCMYVPRGVEMAHR